MSMLLRSMLVLSVTSLLMVGCGETQEEAPVEAAPVAEPAATPVVAAPPAAEPGGYVPTAEERVPGITLDAAAVAAEATASTEAAPDAEAAPKAE